MRRLTFSSIAVAALVACGSSGRDRNVGHTPKAGGSDPPPAAREQSSPDAPAAPPAQLPPVHRDLLVEAGRAELRAGGLWIDAGALDLHKYTRGGWLTGWARNARDGEVGYAATSERTAALELVTLAPAAELVLRARGDKVAVSVDGRSRGTAKLTADWSVVRVVLDPPLPAGRHRVELSSRKPGGAELDWLWLSATAGAAPLASLARVSDEALAAPTPRAYSFYLDVPAGGALHFDTGPAAGATFTVRATTDGAELVELASFTHDGEGWMPRTVSLAPVAGKTVRLDLITEGGGAAWRRPVIRAAPPHPNHPPARGGRELQPAKNLVLLLMDTARADAFAAFAPDGKGVGAAVYDGLAEDSTVFRNAYNNEQWTKPSTATTKTGVYPGTHGARWRVDLVTDELELLSERLKAEGFATASLVSNRSAGPRFGFDQGWDLFEKTGDAEDIFARGLEWIDANREGRFYLFMQSIDAHVPYSVPEKYWRPFYAGTYRGKIGHSFSQDEEDAINDGKLRVTEDDAAWIRALYNGEVLYHDEHFGAFLAGLEQRGLLDDTLIVVLNDHGEDLGEHERFGHGWTMWQPQYRSPLLFRYPGAFPAGRIVEDIVEHVDVAPTIVDVLGVGAMERAEGMTLMPLVRGAAERARPFYALLFAKPDRRGVRVGRWKLIFERDRPSLFDVAADGEERSDLWAERPIAVRMCETHLGEALANPDKRHRLDDVFAYAPYAPGRIDD